MLTEDKIQIAIKAYRDNLMSIQQAAKLVHSSASVLLRAFQQYNIHIRTKEENTKIRIAKFRKTNLEKYGVENPSQNDKIKQKKKQTCLKHYGVENALQSSVIKEKVKKTNIQKYGHENTFQNYTGPNPFSKLEVRAKIKDTLLQRYGVDNPQKSKIIQKKTRQTNLKKYGVEICTKNSQVIEKRRKTDLEKYGVLDHVTQARKLVQYYYNNIYFDSKWELCYYIYHIDHKISIIREPCRLEYRFEHKLHYYYPDFEVDGKLIEIKSDYLFRQMQTPKTRDNAKYNLCLKNNIKILQEKDCKLYINYCESKYGKNFHKKYKYYKNKF